MPTTWFTELSLLSKLSSKGYLSHNLLKKVHQNSDDCIHSQDFIIQIDQAVDSPWVYFNKTSTKQNILFGSFWLLVQTCLSKQSCEKW